MKITILTLFPNMVKPFFEESIIKRATEKNMVQIEVISLRDFAIDEYGTVDDRPYGGGAGMVIRADVAMKAIRTVKDNSSKIVLTSPKGSLFTQKKAEEYSHEKHLVILAGHYEEFDDRVRKEVNEEISLGDFVMTGGEIMAAAIVDSIVRLVPGVLKKEDATKEESFFEIPVVELMDCVSDPVVKKIHKKTVTLLEYPHYTRPEEWEGMKVPEVLLSGDPKKIRKWRLQMAFEDTKKKRPDLLT